MFKNIMIGIGLILLICVLIFSLGIVNLEWTKFFSPRKENIRREVFENTKSYTHGKIQDLAKHYQEYKKVETYKDKEAIRNIIQMNFANFNADYVNNSKLKSFLIQQRGY